MSGWYGYARAGADSSTFRFIDPTAQPVRPTPASTSYDQGGYQPHLLLLLPALLGLVMSLVAIGLIVLM